MWDALEAQHHRFHFKCDSKSLRDRRIDLVGQRENVARSRAASIDERQGVTARNSRRAQGVAFAEARLLNEPCSRDLDTPFVLRFRAGWKSRRMRSSDCCNLLHLLFRDNGILEEAACAAAVGVAINKQHSFRLPNATHRFCDVF